MKRQGIIFLIGVFLAVVLSNMAFSARVLSLPGILQPELVRVDESQIYITEGPNVYIYTLGDLSFVNRFGKQGEGPREFKTGGQTLGWLWLDVRSDHIFVHSLGKLSYYTKKGEFIREQRIGFAYGPVMTPRDNRFVGIGFHSEGKDRFWTTNIYDANMKKIKEIYRYIRAFHPGQAIDLVALKTPSFSLYDNKIYVADTVKTGSISVFDLEGKPLYSLNPAYEKVKLTNKDEKKLRDAYNVGTRKRFYQQYKNDFNFSGYFPAMRFLTVTDEKIYIMTYKREAEKTQFLVLDLKGRLLRKLILPVKDMELSYRRSFEIKGGKFYHFVQLEDEGSQLHITEID